MRFLLNPSLLLTVLAAGCAQAPRQPEATPSAAVPVQPHVFQARLLSAEGCPPGQALFAVPWADSPEYRPGVTFIRAPDPVPTCAELPVSLARAFIGRTLELEKVGDRYRLHSATSPRTNVPAAR